MFRELESKTQIIKNFAPSWFAVIMGTGILAITSLMYSKILPVLKEISYILFYFNILLFFLLLIPWVFRWVFFMKDAIADLKHPINANFYPTLSVGMLVLSADFMVIGKNFSMGAVFWFAGSIITIFFGIYIPYFVFKGEHVKIDHINPAWFIPPVGLIVIPIPGSMLIARYSGLMKEVVMFLNIFGWGTGFFLYVVLLVICVYRFILHKPLPGLLAPTIWINLGPIGAGTVALYGIVEHLPMITVKEPLFFSGMLLWSFGMWWLVIAIFMTIHYIRKLELTYAMSWWAFTFPLGAYVAATHKVYIFSGFSLIEYSGFILYWLLLFLWAITFILTLKNVYRGSVFVK